MIERLVIFGAGGDLTGRYLLPALARLRAEGRLPDRFEVIGAGRGDDDDAGFREHAARELDEHAPDLPGDARARLLDSLSYRRADAADAESVGQILGPASPTAIYLALPPAVFPGAVEAIAAAGLHSESRIALEKPFGESLEEAVSLNRLLARLFGDQSERVVFRVDHALGMSCLQNLLGLRFANRVTEAVWNSDHIERIDLLWEETLGLEGRAGYFDSAGALKDVMQNHLIQVLCFVAMEPPETADELADRKVELLRAVRPPDPGRSRRARYGAGRLRRPDGAEGDEIPAYADEDGVDPSRGTETFAEFSLEVGNSRWQGTEFRLRAGKALPARRKEVVIHFRPASRPALGMEAHPTRLRIGIDGPEDLVLDLNGTPDGPPEVEAMRLAAPPVPGRLPAYARVLEDLIGGGHRMSVSGEEAELGWSVVRPILDAWGADQVPLEEYPAGSRPAVG